MKDEKVCLSAFIFEADLNGVTGQILESDSIQAWVNGAVKFMNLAFGAFVAFVSI